MILKNKLDNIDLTDGKLVLTLQRGKKQIVSFSDLEDINVILYDSSPVQEVLFILLSIGIMMLSLLYLQFDLLLLIPLLFVICIAVMVDNYKCCYLRIDFKDGTLFRKQISDKLKVEILPVVKNITEEIDKFRNENNQESTF
ncbi:hypothetical protein [Flavobacterium sp. 123]|uniref:hypothetical protein n=1 Tax=Flavobacterium sp. 123 TaxID=2135627 RepID=UPI000EB30001|nr:hypothetical protein [Flavobacterium sp. 123]RKT00101.1 hypothetical protein C8C88_1917 [Flavobacterium sp. 123]